MTTNYRRIRKVFIANRGEIARRINRTLRELGYRAVVGVSEADVGAEWLRETDELVILGPAPPAESYLSIPRVVDAAVSSGADAVHPGYGFLSENAAFARACEAAGLVFIGPPPAAMEAMASKAKAKVLAAAAGAPVVPGYGGPDQSDAALIRAGEAIGFPLMVKASEGGGGRGMRLVNSEAQLPDALAVARSEALNAFGSGELILERAILNGRHIEVQIFADAQGNVVHLGERDCSSQRRHQKVIEEAPSPAVDAALRARMGEAAVRIAAAAGYRNAGTLEFMLGEDGSFYFLEMNTRLQVEHPVTECVTGLDLVALQMHVAEGRPLPFAQEDVRLEGHAIELRLYAEDPDEGFLPQSGTLVAWRPPRGEGVRVDHAIATGERVTTFYDPMIAKLIIFGADREEARRRAVEAVRATVALGFRTNRRFLHDLLEDPMFVTGEVTTRYLDERAPAVFPGKNRNDLLWMVAAVAVFKRRAWHGAASLRSWSSTGLRRTPVWLTDGKEQRHFLVRRDGARFALEVAGAVQRIELSEGEPEGALLKGRCEGEWFLVACAEDGNGEFHLEFEGAAVALREVGRTTTDGDARSVGSLLAPMAGAVTALLVELGASVRKGQVLLVLEAMKMQHELRAPAAAIVSQLDVKVGDQVVGRQVLMCLVEEEDVA